MTTVRARWLAKLATRKALLAHARRQAAYWRRQKARAKPGTPRYSHAAAMLAKREAKVKHRIEQVAYAQRVLANHPPGSHNAGKGSFGVDWAWGQPNILELQHAGVKFAARYLSHDPGKNLTLAQARALARARIDCVVVWETTANRATAGFDAGVTDAKAALTQAKAAGKPDSAPIYFAVDFDGVVGQVRDYFRGAASVLGVKRVGAYGGIRVISGLLDAGLITWAWQTYAWSGGKWDPRAQLQQYSNGHTLAGISCDYDRAMSASFGQWTPGGA